MAGKPANKLSRLRNPTLEFKLKDLLGKALEKEASSPQRIAQLRGGTGRVVEMPKNLASIQAAKKRRVS